MPFLAIVSQLQIQFFYNVLCEAEKEILQSIIPRLFYQVGFQLNFALETGRQVKETNNYLLSFFLLLSIPVSGT